MRQVQLAEMTAKNIRTIVAAGEDVMVFDGGEPVARLVVRGAELQRRKDYFTFYPHEAAECFGTCWRHDGSADAEKGEQGEQAPVGEPVTASA